MKLGKHIMASDGPVLVTVPDVPICATGIEYALSSGPATFTEDDLADAVMSQDDPAVHAPRLKLGHIDPRYNGPQYDATPAFGKATNLRLSSDRQVLIGDYVGVPKWLADVMPVAYPNKSIEGNLEVETVTGHKWGLVIWRVALLGVEWPGVSVLEDLPLYYGEEMPPGVKVYDETGEEVEAMRVAASPAPVTAAIATEDIRRAYYDSLDADQMWWWVRSMYLDPNELIVDADDGGTLYRVPFTVDGEEVKFDDPIEVKIQYVDAKLNGQGGRKERRALALVASAGRQVASWENKAESRPQDDKEASVGVNIPKLRERTGLTAEQLPDDATEEQINAALEGDEPEEPETDESGATPDEQTRTDGPSQPQTQPGEGGQPAEAEPSPSDTPQEGEPATAAGMVAIPKAEWERTQRTLGTLSAKSEEEEKQKRASILNAAIRDGKVRPADRESYQNGLDNEATRTQYEKLLTASVSEGGLAPNIVPVAERGGSGANPADVSAGEAEYNEDWLSPGERARIQAVKAGTHQPELVQSDVQSNGAGRS